VHQLSPDISPDEQTFFVQLGAHIAELRTSAGITHVQLAAFLGVSPQTVNACEARHRRTAISALPRLARLVGVLINELIGEPAKPGKRGPTPVWQQNVERLSRLPKTLQKVVMKMLDVLLAQAGR